MAEIAAQIRHLFASRHVRSWQESGTDVIEIRATARNGNWPMIIRIGPGDRPELRSLSVRSMLPFRVSKERRDSIVELLSHLDGSPERGRFEFRGDSARVEHVQTISIAQDEADHSLIRSIDGLIAEVDGHLPSFFAVVSGAQTPMQAVDQLERKRRYG